MIQTVQTAVTSEVTSRLLQYLQSRLGLEVRYAERPVYFPDSWQADIFRFRLESSPSVPRELSSGLVLRAYSSENGWPRLQHEYAVQQYLHGVGYPAPEPLLIEKDPLILGGPFMIMEALPGEQMLTLMLRRLMSIFWAPAAMARAQAQLHLLRYDGFPVSEEPFLHRRLAQLRQIIADYDFSGLMPGLGWLRRYRPRSPEPPCIVHLDFHPANLLFHRWRFRGVVDWCESDVGDRHADIASTLLLIDSTPLENLSWRQRAVSRLGRYLLRELYLRSYRRVLRLDNEKLRYYLAWAALSRLARWGMWLRDGPLITGSKRSALEHVTDGAVALLEHYFERMTGVAIRLESSTRIRPLQPAVLSHARHIDG